MEKTTKKTNVRRMTLAALCAALSAVLMLLSFSVPVLSPFAKFDFSALPELIGGYILGPVGAIIIIVLKVLLKLLFEGTSSLFTGEVQNLLLSMAYVLPAVLYYRKHRTKKGAVVGLVISSVFSVVVAIFTNVYLIFPAYIKLYGMNWDSIIQICAGVNPWIKNIPTFVAFSVVPFNLISRAVTSLIAVLVYKRLSVPIKKLIQ